MQPIFINNLPVYAYLARILAVSSGNMADNRRFSCTIRPDQTVYGTFFDMHVYLVQWINPNTIQKAYRELEQEGFIYTVSGKGSFAAPLSDVQSKRKEELI